METLATALYYLPVYQCIVLAILLFAQHRMYEGRSRWLMGVFQLLLAFYFTFNLFYKVRLFELIADLYFFIIPIILSFVPVFYLYILSVTTHNFRLRSVHLLHFIPAFLILLLNAPYLLISHEDKLLYLSMGNNAPSQHAPVRYLLTIYMIGAYGISNLQLFFYLVRTIRVYRIHRKFILDHYSNTENIDLRWILITILALILFFIINNVLYIVGFKQHILSQVFYTVSMLGITLFAGIQGLRQKELLDIKTVRSEFTKRTDDLQVNSINVPVNGEKEEPKSLTEPLINIHTEVDIPGPETLPTHENQGFSEKYSGSALTAEQKQIILKRLEALMLEDKLFMISNLSVEDVADRLGTNSKYISQVINESYKRNFYNFINTFRIEEARKLLGESGNDKYSILGIAHMVGFVSKSTFNTAFKRYTGITPSEFKKGKIANK
ncbi:MAG: helix-turn-helix domain-containing protein [Bacteroidetes bacterium]|nr:helix-turn-helix domain-containing protein [Bacteroidota bacterium]